MFTLIHDHPPQLPPPLSTPPPPTYTLPWVRPEQESIFCLLCDYEKGDTQESELENSYTCTPLC